MSPTIVMDGDTENGSTIFNATGNAGDEPENEEDEEEEEHVREMIEVEIVFISYPEEIRKDVFLRRSITHLYFDRFSIREWTSRMKPSSKDKPRFRKIFV